MGLAVLLIAMILLGLMGDGENKGNKVWLGIGTVIFLFVLFGALGDTVWLGGIGYNLAGAGPALLAIVLVLAILGAIVGGVGAPRGNN